MVRKDALLVEIQLRSVVQHSWAEAVEASDRDSLLRLKEGRAPDYVVEYYRLGADLLELQERDERPAVEKLRRFQNLHEHVTGNRRQRSD